MPPSASTSRPERLRISTVAERAGVSRQTVEYYILLGLITPARDPRTRRRIFTEDHVRRVVLIRQLNQSGYPLREIREIWLRDKET
ncbi:MAG: MerR family transcriptional regulator [Planctomycetes bacterium]|mgnify:FL=1|nr:MerR family transcriptional regulator [Planctomycetota bacterium]